MDKNWFTIKNIHHNIYGIGEFGHFEEVISYLFIGKAKALLFDTGMGIGDIKKVVDSLTDLPLTVINSHCHFDHIGGNKSFHHVSLLETSFSKHVAASGIANSDLKEFVHADSFFQNPPSSFDANTYAISSFVYSPLLNGQTITIDPFTFTVIATPGHSPDSICLYEQTQKILLTGDTLYDGPIYLFFKESNIQEYKKSIQRLVKYDIQTILPGHNDFSINPLLLKKTSEISSKKLINKSNIYILQNLSLVISK